jgi:hypothetical protein
MRGLRDEMRYQMEFNVKQGVVCLGMCIEEKEGGFQERVEEGWEENGKFTVLRKGLRPNNFW